MQKSSEESPKWKQFAQKEQCEAWGREARYWHKHDFQFGQGDWICGTLCFTQN